MYAGNGQFMYAGNGQFMYARLWGYSKRLLNVSIIDINVRKKTYQSNIILIFDIKENE